MSEVSDLPDRRASLEMLAKHLRRDSELFTREPSMLSAQIHNSLWLEEGSREGADFLLRRAREELACRTWLQLRNRPPVTRSPILCTASHGSSVWALAWHQGARALASGGSDGRIKSWERSEARLLDVLDPGRGPVNALACSPDGTILASGHDDGTVCLWSAGGDRSARISTRFSGAVLSLGWSADGGILAIGLSGGELRLLDAGSLLEGVSPASTAAPIRALAMSPDGKTVAFPEAEGTIALCDTRSAELRALLVDQELHEQVSRVVEEGGRRVDVGGLFSYLARVLSIAWSSDGTTLAVGTGAGARLWDVASRSLGRVLQVDKPGVPALSWQPLGTLLAMGIGLGEVWLWDSRTGVEVPVPVGHRKTVQSLAWSADGRVLASADEAGTVIFWDIDALETLVRSASERPQSDAVISLALSSDGTRMVSGGSSNTLRVWDALGRQVSVVEKLPGPVIGLSAFEGGFLFSPFSTDWTDIVLWERLDQRPRGVFRGDTGGCGCALALSPDSRLVACGDLMGSVWIRELESGRLIRVHRMPDEDRVKGSAPRPNQAESIAWSPDSSLVGCLAQRSAAVWSTRDTEPLVVLDLEVAPANGDDGTLAHSPGVLVHFGVGGGDVVWSPDGTLLAVSARDGGVTLWRSADWSRSLELPSRDHVTSLAWSADGSRLVSGDSAGMVRVWRIPCGAIEAAALCVSAVADLRFGSDPTSLYVADDGAASLGCPLLYAFALASPHA